MDNDTMTLAENQAIGREILEAERSDQQRQNALVDARDAWETAVVKLAALRKTQQDLSNAMIEANVAAMAVAREVPELEAAYRGLLLEVHGVNA